MPPSRLILQQSLKFIQGGLVKDETIIAETTVDQEEITQLPTTQLHLPMLPLLPHPLLVPMQHLVTAPRHQNDLLPPIVLSSRIKKTCLRLTTMAICLWVVVVVLMVLNPTLPFTHLRLLIKLHYYLANHCPPSFLPSHPKSFPRHQDASSHLITTTRCMIAVPTLVLPT